MLDEVQQYIGQSGDRSAVFTEVAEAIQTQFDGRVALVASGQSALSAVPALQKLRDRFRIQVELTDADVEKVTRAVLLRKKASGRPRIEEMFADCEGEVARHLRETRLAAGAADGATRVDDYPLLGARRRFWEACLRAIEPGEGVHSQLRSQLRILHDSLVALGDRPLGAVIPASDLFHAVSADLVNLGVLLNEVHTRITKLDDKTEAGRLRRDLVALVFLIGKLPREKGVDTGARADAATLADLLVTDLNEDSGPFRKRVADELDALAGEGVLMRVGAEFRIQTTEGAEWDRDFRQTEAGIRNDDAAIAAARDDLFRAGVQEILSGVRLRHGASNERRTLALHLAADPPPATGDAVSVWLRDGWQGSRRSSSGRRAPGEPPIRRSMCSSRSAARRTETPDRSGAGRPARPRPSRRPALRRRQGGAEQHGEPPPGGDGRRDGIVRDLLRQAKVLQGGGSEVYGDDLAAKIHRGAEASLARLFPRFDDGDHAAWGIAVGRARDGSDRPFAPVGWDRDAPDHPVAREVMTTVGTGGPRRRGHRTLRAAPFGWPQDAVDAALIALFGAGTAARGAERTAARARRPRSGGVKTAVFRPEQVVLTVRQRLAIRGLFQRMEVSVPSGAEQQGAAEFLAALRALSKQAGGEPPLPAPPVSALLEDLGRKTGNEQLLAIHESRDELDRLREQWTALANRSGPRKRQWKRTAALRKRAAGLPVLDEVEPELDAILAQRSLLEDTDRVAPLGAKLAAALRKELTALHQSLDEALRHADTELAADPNWAALNAASQDEIRTRHRLLPPSPLDLATDEALLRTLDDRPLAFWRAEADAAPARTARALADAAALAAPPPPAEPEGRTRPPTAVTLRRATLADEAAVREWLRETETALLEEIGKGPVTIR